MGKEKTIVNTNTVTESKNTQQAEMTPEEKRLLELDVQAREATQPQQLALQQQGLDLVSQLLAGSTNLPGFLGDLGRGLSEDQISDISQKAVADLRPSFQSSGILDSGVAAAVSGQVAGDIRRAASEYNLGNRFNLLNLALGGQAQVQQPLLAQQANLTGQLAGLRSITSTGTGSSFGTQTTLGMNPFVKSFQQSLGQSLGTGQYGSSSYSGGSGDIFSLASASMV